MSTPNLGPFLEALDALKGDYTCSDCGELCKDPVILSTCFHLICSEHSEVLKFCPTCKEPLPLKGCKTYKDDRIQTCIDSAKELDKMFETFRNTSNNMEQSDKDSKMVSVRSDRFKTGSKTDNLNSTMATNVTSGNKVMEKRNYKGETPLHVACRLGKIEKVTELLNQGANTNTKDNAGWTPLHEAVQNGRLDLVKLLLQFNTLINVPGLKNETPLHEAIRYQHVEIIEELVKNGADIHARNCKGETPFDLASDELKTVIENAAENLIQTQGFNESLIEELYMKSAYDEIRVFCISGFRTIHKKLKTLCKYHSNLQLEAKMSNKVTHIIVDVEIEDDVLVCISSLDILFGIVYGCWIISSQWVMMCTEEKLEPFKDHLVRVNSETFDGARKARFNKYKQLPGLLNGCHFYIHNFNTKYEISKTIVLNKAILTKLIVDAGGIILRRVPNPELIPEAEKLVPYHAKKGSKLAICSHYILFKDFYEPMYKMQHLKALPISWLIDCIERFELNDP